MAKYDITDDGEKQELMSLFTSLEYINDVLTGNHKDSSLPVTDLILVSAITLDVIANKFQDEFIVRQTENPFIWFSKFDVDELMNPVQKQFTNRTRKGKPSKQLTEHFKSLSAHVAGISRAVSVEYVSVPLLWRRLEELKRSFEYPSRVAHQRDILLNEIHEREDYLALLRSDRDWLKKELRSIRSENHKLWKELQAARSTSSRLKQEQHDLDKKLQKQHKRLRYSKKRKR